MYKESLLEKWNTFKKENPRVRIRDAAVELKTSEMALVATGCNDKNCRLNPDFEGILKRLESLGSVMALTRSDHAVHESHGVYQNMKSHDNVAIFLKPGIDTRFFLEKWSEVYVVNENERHSIQFFDANGDAIHKIFVTEETNSQAFLKLVKDFRSSNQESHLDKNDNKIVSTKIKHIEEIEINSHELIKSWSEMQDVHDSGNLIKKYGNHRRNEVYDALGQEYAVALEGNSIEQVLEIASEKAEELMIFVMNHAAVQVYSGSIKKLLRTGPWFNILDPSFNLHLRTEGIGDIWLIRKPTKHGFITSIDVLDKNGMEFLLITENKNLEKTESQEWKDIYNSPLVKEKTEMRAAS